MTIMRAWASFGATDINNDNELDIDELKTLIWVVDGKEPDEKRVQFDMKNIDEDGSGTVDRLEWISYLVAPAGEDFDFDVKAAFDMFDVNKDGKIDEEEFFQILKDTFKEILAKKDEKEYGHSVELIKELAREIFKDIDEDGGGELDWPEFKNFRSIKKDKYDEVKALLENEDD